MKKYGKERNKHLRRKNYISEDVGRYGTPYGNHQAVPTGKHCNEDLRKPGNGAGQGKLGKSVWIETKKELTWSALVKTEGNRNSLSLAYTLIEVRALMMMKTMSSGRKG